MTCTSACPAACEEATRWLEARWGGNRSAAAGPIHRQFARSAEETIEAQMSVESRGRSGTLATPPHESQHQAHREQQPAEDERSRTICTKPHDERNDP